MPSDHISAVWYRLGDDAASFTQYNSIATKKSSLSGCTRCARRNMLKIMPEIAPANVKKMLIDEDAIYI